MHKLSPLVLGICLAPGLALAQPEDQTSKWAITADLSVTGGLFINDHLREFAAGREHQIKMTEARVGLTASNGDLTVRVEPALINDAIRVEPGNSVYQDIYRNLGTSLYYYGDYDIREAFVGKFSDDHYWRAGRLLTLNGVRTEDGLYSVAQEAPHAAILQTGILNGVQAGVWLFNEQLEIEGGVLWGRDRPCLDSQCYLNGRLDVNEKGNNTPVIEAKITYTPTERLSIYGYGLFNKTGSAPGTYWSGKHNDQRYALGMSADLYEGEWASVALDAQWNQFVIGLTEEGIQGEATPLESYNLTRSGYYGTASVDVYPAELRFQVTHEVLDRADEAAFAKIAGFDESHPVMDETESRTIVSIIHQMTPELSIRLFHRSDDVPSLTGGDAELEDRVGAVMKFSSEF